MHSDNKKQPEFESVLVLLVCAWGIYFAPTSGYGLKGNEGAIMCGVSRKGLSDDIIFGQCSKASLVAQTVKCLPTMREPWVRSLGQEGNGLEKEMATHSSTLAWKIPWTEEPSRLQSMGLQKSRT